MFDSSHFLANLTVTGFINPPYNPSATEISACSLELIQLAEHLQTMTKLLRDELLRVDDQQIEKLLLQLKASLQTCHATRLEGDCVYIIEHLTVRGVKHCAVHIEKLISDLTAFSIAIQMAQHQAQSSSAPPKTVESSSGNLLAMLRQALTEFDDEKSMGTIDKLEKHGMSGQLESIKNFVRTFEFDKALWAFDELQAGTASSGAETRKRIILAVDDMPQNLSMIKTIIGDTYKFVGVTSGEAALKYLETNLPDVYILDIDMPKMNGFELVEAIRAKRKIAPVIFLTANATAHYVTTAVEMGITHFLVKPCNKEAVFAKLQSLFSPR